MAIRTPSSMPFDAKFLLFYNNIMSKHLTINGQAYASVEEMPSAARKQYEEAMQMLASKTSEAVRDATDLNLTTVNSRPDGHTSKTYTAVTSTRFKVNGKEYDHWEDIPLIARAAMEGAGMGPHRSAQADVQKTQDSTPPGVTMRPGTLIVLLVIAAVAGH
jgi:hypothetical protein